MDSDLTQSQAFWKAYAWFEARKKQVIYGAVAVAALGLVVYFILWQRAQKEAAAGHALSKAHTAQMGVSGQTAGGAEAYLKVASEFPGSSASVRALILGAGALFAEGKYEEAETQFRRFTREHVSSPFLGQALLGVAASLEAQGKTNEAVSAYSELIQRRPNEPIIPQARFALARLYEAQNKPELARDLFEEINRDDRFSSLGSEAGIRLEELKAKHPEWAVVATNAITAITNAPAGTNAAGSASPLAPTP